ncbi:hypothetical protein [Eisenibacter elegans]|jgi:hypothetical protein|uniref:hypothetical protein n=1 Tax=Eisenibacter elegans TaxID=997 RepID=UPI000416CE3F|nr:hypothetical protein [Eisenibacter elegans]
MRTTLAFFLLLTIASGAARLYAQGGAVQEQQVVIEKDARIDLPILKKNAEKAVPEPLKRVRGRIQYELNTPNYETQPLEVNLALPETQAVDRPVLDRSKEGYLMGGIGNFATTYLEGLFTQKISPNFSYGLHGKHWYARRGPVGGADYSANNLHGVGAYADFFTETAHWHTDLSYTRQMFRYYGYAFENDNLPFGDSLRQVFQRVDWSLRYQNKSAQSPWQYLAALNVRSWSSRENNSEQQLQLQGQLNYHWNERWQMGIYADGSYVALRTAEQPNNENARAWLGLHPTLIRKDSVWRAEVGVVLLAQQERQGQETELRLLPHLLFSYDWRPILRATIGFVGQLQANTLYSLSRENPFIATDALPRNTVRNYELFLKLQGDLSPEWNYQVRAAWANDEQFYLFLNNPLDPARFDVLYVPTNAQTWSLKAQTEYELKPGLQAGGSLQYLYYQLPETTEAWHRPSWVGNTHLSYDPIKNLRLNLDFYLYAGIKAFNFNAATTVDLPLIADLNLQAEYMLWKHWSVFARTNNLFGNTYQQYYRYPVRGLNFLIGLTYDFR